MSSVVKAVAQRGAGHFRAALHVAVGCALLGGCSSGSDRFSFFSLGSGYEGTSPTPAAAKSTAYSPSQTAYQPASSRAPADGGVQLASAQADQTGYLQVSRVDLPPLQTKPDDGRVKTADGYGAYNQPPLPDGTYSGPRVYTPYDRQGPSQPPAGAYDDQAQPGDRTDPPSSFYRRQGADAPPYGARPGVYEPLPNSGPSDGGRGAYRQPPYQGAPGNEGRGRPEGRVVVVRPGDTLYSIATRFGMTPEALARANGLSSLYVRPGQELFIPFGAPAAYNPGPAETPRLRAAECSGPSCHVVKPGETLASIARANGLSERALLEANSLPNPKALRVGQALTIPGNPRPAQQQVANAAGQGNGSDRSGSSLQQSQPQTAAGPPAPQTQSKITSRLAPDTALPQTPAAPQPVVAEPTCEAALANPLPRTGKTFRKPVEGMTIAQFGPQRDGTVNEGVTISVPKGTPIKAAENGVVAYVGDELPGFGNLILIRHADEYVTAYAHADEIKVKRCEIVKRGQVIATAGSTGDASQPQLHFEIRKNSKPVDPTPLLGS